MQLPEFLSESDDNMNKKISLGLALSLIAIASAVTFILTSFFSLQSFNKKVVDVNEKGKIRHKALYVNKESLLKVLLLQHISKAEMFVPSSEQWKINKGILYEFNPNLQTSMKLCERSLFICSKYDIKFTEEEYDAMKVLDREDDKANIYLSPLAQLVKISNQLTSTESYQQHKSLKDN